MATGVPKSRRSTLGGEPREHVTRTNASIELTYAGKAPAEEVLKTEAGDFQLQAGAPSSRNRLYFADNLRALAHLRDDPAIAGKVNLIYIDPPYATGTVFHSRSQTHAYEDTLGGAAFVEFLRQRLILLRDLLADDGSIYVHLDSKMVCEIKLVMDEIFGPAQFRNLISRKKCNPKNYTTKSFGNISDYILFYTKGTKYTWQRPVEAWTPGRAKEYRYVEPETGRAFMKVPVHAPGVRNGETGGEWRGMLPPPGKHWQYRPSTLDEMDARGEIAWSPSGNPRRKVYLDESAGVPVQDIWLDFKDAHNQMICITGYPTEKNSDLIKRIILASSNEGDLVLDCFAGSGTTLVCAEELGRRWIGVDSSPEAVRVMSSRFRGGSTRMGDFTSHRNGIQEVESPTSSPLELFGPEGDDSLSEEPLAAPQITDYSLWVQRELVSELPEAVGESVVSK